MKLILTPLLCLITSLLMTANAVEYAPIEFSLERGGLVRVTGDWPDSCVPTTESARAELISGVITITNASRADDCDDTISGFSVALAVSGMTTPALKSQATDETMTVQFLQQGDNQSFAKLIAFDALMPTERKSARAQVLPESGIWWPQRGGEYDTSGPGIGFSIERQHDQLVTIINWYDNDGSPLWLLATGQVEQGIFRAELSSLEGGPGLFEDYTEATPVFDRTRLSIVFHGPATATAWISQPLTDKPGSEILLKPLSLVRFAFGYDSMNRFTQGRWLLVVQDEERKVESTVLDFRQSGAERNTITLRDRNLGYSMDCTINRQRSTTPASLCVLNESFHVPLATFTEVGLDRMVGIDESGQQAQLIRLDTGW